MGEAAGQVVRQRCWLQEARVEVWMSLEYGQWCAERCVPALAYYRD